MAMTTGLPRILHVSTILFCMTGTSHGFISTPVVFCECCVCVVCVCVLIVCFVLRRMTKGKRKLEKDDEARGKTVSHEVVRDRNEWMREYQKSLVGGVN